jgi:hypothetical protein
MRASWKVDLKWAFGLICVVCGMIAGLLYSFQAITSHDTATAMFTDAVGGYASGSISDGEYAAIQAAAAQDPNTAVVLPGIASPLPGSAIVSLPKDEAVKLALTAVAETNYEQGADAAKPLLTLNDEDGGEFSVGPLGVLTRDNHDGAAKFARIFGVVALAAGALAVVFSNRFGRIGTPGILLIVSMAPLALLWSFISSRTGSVSGEEGVFVRSLAEAFTGPASDNVAAFIRLAIMGVGLVTAAIVGHVGWPFASRWWESRRASTPATEDSPPVPPSAGVPTA